MPGISSNNNVQPIHSAVDIYSIDADSYLLCAEDSANDYTQHFTVKKIFQKQKNKKMKQLLEFIINHPKTSANYFIYLLHFILLVVFIINFISF